MKKHVRLYRFPSICHKSLTAFFSNQRPFFFFEDLFSNQCKQVILDFYFIFSILLAYLNNTLGTSSLGYLCLVEQANRPDVAVLDAVVLEVVIELQNNIATKLEVVIFSKPV